MQTSQTHIAARMRAAVAALFVALSLSLVFVAPATGLTRSEIVARGKYWVNAGVPYSQSAYFQGYRTDCSGMASMMWQLDRSYTTRSLAAFGLPIQRDELQPGDMLLKYDYHAAIFYKWDNGEHTHYWTLEQSGSAGGAVARLVRYPFWDVQGFVAYRPRHVTELDDYGPYVTAVQGADRYETSIAGSKLAFAAGAAETAVVCSGENWPDALGGTALAGAVEGPMLLTRGQQVRADLLAELTRLGVRNVYVVGGTSVVSTSVAEAIDAMPSVDIQRLGGADRYETAALVARETVASLQARGRTYDGGIYLSTGRDYPDALGSAPSAAHTGRPILLAAPSTVPTSTRDAIRDLGVDQAFIAGGTGALGSSTEQALVDLGVNSVTRIAGVDRYDTSLRLAEHGVSQGLSWRNLGLATGYGFPDALSGASIQARRGSVLVLTTPWSLGLKADTALRDHSGTVSKATVYGGEAVVSRLARRQIRWILAPP